MTLDEALGVCPIIAILRGVTPGEVQAHCEALLEAGLCAVEIPLNSPDPLSSLARVAGSLAGALALGAGTVLTPEEVHAVAGAGGAFIVSPNTDSLVIAAALARELIPIPGFATASEAFAAVTAGARRLKLFPAATYGPAHLAALKAVLPPSVPVFAVGGVGPAQMAAWRAAGAAGFGLGSEVYRAGQSPAETLAKGRAVRAALLG